MERKLSIKGEKVQECFSSKLGTENDNVQGEEREKQDIHLSMTEENLEKTHVIKERMIHSLY